MDKELKLENIVLLGRRFEEYCGMFALDEGLLARARILDAASGVSSFCAEANAQGYRVTASDVIYSVSADVLEEKCSQDLDKVMGRLPAIRDMYVWDNFKDIAALKSQRAGASRIFLEDFRRYGRERYVPAEYPGTGFADEEFDLALCSHFLFMYEDRLDYDFHKQTLWELARIAAEEVRIFPLVNLKGRRSAWVSRLIEDTDLKNFSIEIRKVEYEFMKGADEMMIVRAIPAEKEKE